MTTDAVPAFDLSRTFVHLGLGAVAIPIPDFSWTQDFLEKYQRDTELDGQEGRLVSVSRQAASWTSWERHPAGDELVVQLGGRVHVIQERDGAEQVVELSAGMALINPRNVWHTADVVEPGDTLFITPGIGTQQRAR